MSRLATATNANGSCAVTPNSRLVISRVSPRAAPMPMATPANANCDGPRLVLPGGALQRVRPLEGVRPRDPHLPPVITLGADDQNSPVPRPVRAHVLDERRDLPQRYGVPRVVHLH